MNARAAAPGRANVRLANEAWEALLTAHARLLARFAADGVFTQVSMREYDVLYTLAKHAAPMRLRDIAAGVLLSQPALSRLVERLVARGLLSRCADDDDGRAVRIWLTDQGASLQREIGRRHARSIAHDLGAALTPDELRELRRLTTKLAAQTLAAPTAD